MKFSGFTVSNGFIYRSNLYDTDCLPQSSSIVDECREALHLLKDGASGVQIAGIVLALGLPVDLVAEIGLTPDLLTQEYGDRSRFFCLTAPGREIPFEVNLVLRSNGDSERDRFAIGTILSLSRYLKPLDWAVAEKGIKRIMPASPSLTSIRFSSERASPDKHCANSAGLNVRFAEAILLEAES